MAAIVTPPAIEHVLRESARRYNACPDEAHMPSIDMSSRGVSELCRIIVKYQYHSLVRLRVMHRHLDLRQGFLLLETPITPGYWTRPTPIQNLDMHQISGQVFGVSDGGLSPTEFCHRPCKISLDAEFTREFSQACYNYGVENVLGIEIARDQDYLVELSNDSGSILIPEQMIHLPGGVGIRSTSWTVTADGHVGAKPITMCVRLDNRHVEVHFEDVENAKDDRNTNSDVRRHTIHASHAASPIGTVKGAQELLSRIMHHGRQD